jgi:AraC-like DNA-binding protein
VRGSLPLALTLPTVMQADTPRRTISAKLLLRVVAYCSARGHDAEALCQSAGVSLASLGEADARVRYETAARLGERALELTRDDNFGLHLAQDVKDTSSFDVGALLLMASPTLAVALERMAAHQRYWGDGQRATLRPGPTGLAVRYALPGAVGPYARHADECAMAEIALGARVLSGQMIDADIVRFRHPAPRSTAEHAALFGCPIEFGCAHTEIAFGVAALETKLAHANDAFLAIFEHQVERAIARLPAATSASGAVRATARASLAGGGCTLAGTARSLGVSTRTLQRHLQAEGASFAEIIDALRREMALAYLERQVPLLQVAEMLGYSDATAFHHAFRRWTGLSPARFPGLRRGG